MGIRHNPLLQNWIETLRSQRSMPLRTLFQSQCAMWQGYVLEYCHEFGKISSPCWRKELRFDSLLLQASEPVGLVTSLNLDTLEYIAVYVIDNASVSKHATFVTCTDLDCSMQEFCIAVLNLDSTPRQLIWKIKHYKQAVTFVYGTCETCTLEITSSIISATCSLSSSLRYEL